MRTLVATALLAATALARRGGGGDRSSSSSSRSVKRGDSERNESHSMSVDTDAKETYFYTEWEPRTGHDDAFLLSVSTKQSDDIYNAQSYTTFHASPNEYFMINLSTNAETAPGEIQLDAGNVHEMNFVSLTLKDGEEWVKVNDNLMVRRVHVEDGYAKVVIELSPWSGLETDTSYFVDASMSATATKDGADFNYSNNDSFSLEWASKEDWTDWWADDSAVGLTAYATAFAACLAATLF